MDTSATVLPDQPLPGFRPPANLRLDPPLPEVTEEGPETSPSTPESPGGPPDRPARRPAGAATRTGTSSAGTDLPTAAETAALIAGLLGLALVGVAAVIRWRGRRQLRQPTKGQMHDIAAPLARIALRHVPAELLNPDLADAASAGAAFAAYVNDGPLIEPVYVDAGLPADLQDPEQEIS